MQRKTYQAALPEAAPAVAVIPPLPGGGSWRWNGTGWVSKNPPAVKALVQTPPATEE